MNVRRLFPFALFTLLFATAVKPTIDPDLWWHLKTGEWVLDNGIPHTDVFSHTFPNNEWVTHEWLSDVLMWTLYQLGGLGFLQVVFAAVTVATWLIVYRLTDGKPYIAGMLVAVAAKASEVVWGSRPQLFNLLLFALFMYLLEARKDGRLGRWIYGIFPVATVLWANLHSGFLLGIVLLGTYFVGELVEARRREPGLRTLLPTDRHWLGLATVGSLLAALVNPNGIRLWIYPFETLVSPAQRRFITEWFPPTPDQLIFWLTVVLVVVGLLALRQSSRRVTATEMLMFGGTAVGAFLSLRNIPIFAIAAVPVIARHAVTRVSLDRFVDDPAETEAALPTLVAGAVIIAGAILIAIPTISDNDHAISNVFPVEAVDWMAANHPEATIFNAYDFGGYLIWREIPVYIDGRADVFRDEGLNQYTRTAFVEAGWREPLARYGVDLVIIEAGSRLADALAGEPGWNLEYVDDVASVLVLDG